MFQKLIFAVILIAAGLLCLQPFKSTHFYCNHKLECQVYTSNILTGGKKSNVQNMTFATKDIEAKCDYHTGGYRLRLGERVGHHTPYTLMNYSKAEECRSNARLLNSKLRTRHGGISDYVIHGASFFEMLLYGLFGFFLLFLGILTPFVAKTDNELTPEEKAKAEAQSEAVRAKVESFVNSNGVNNIKKAADKAEELANNPLVQILRMFIK